MFKHILIPTDGSKTAAKAIKAGVALAQEMGARITGFYAQEPLPTHIHGEGYVVDGAIAKEFERRAAEYGRRALEEIGAAARAANVPFEAVMAQATQPHKAIIETAEKQHCDVIFIASHGHRGLAGLFVGSVTQKVLNHSTLPVLVFR